MQIENSEDVAGNKQIRQMPQFDHQENHTNQMVTEDNQLKQNDQNNQEKSNQEQVAEEATAKEAKKMTIIDALERVGSKNKYQILFFLFSGFVWLFGATSILSPTFTFEKPAYNCPDTVSSDKCESWVCDQPNPSDYFSTHPESFVMAFDPPLICGRQYIADMSVAFCYAGSAIGFIVSLYIADNKGRKIGTIIFWILAAVGAYISTIFGFNIGASVFGFALSQFGANSAINIVFCIMNDHSLGKFREYTMAALNPFYGVGGCVLVLMAVITPKFRLIMLCIAVPITISCIYLFFFYDPPLFLYEKNKQQAIDVLNKIAKINNRPTVQYDEVEDKEVQIKSSRIYGLKDLFKYRSLRYNAICSGLILFFVQISYYGSNLILSQIGLDTKLNALTTSIADTCGYLAIVPIITHIRRKRWSFCPGIIYSVIFICFNQITVPDDCGDNCSEKKLQTALVTIARFFLTFEWGLAFIYITEIFPTTVRTIGLGFASFVGYLGSVFSSYFLTYLINQGINPLLGMGVVSIISLVFYFPMTETYGVPQQAEIKELVEEERINQEKQKEEEGKTFTKNLENIKKDSSDEQKELQNISQINNKLSSAQIPTVAALN
ncbi:MFS transporter (macronuclear) [Tetrahymena thermophila SB210]|uniref:MFS transporter n=1 Tax=Tetrahymena thermophila (strain SB210) TaxID=312017 RepID=I7M1K7_TETTS|nr:MFS transporter [Tetrahymena thermophila SB210]EAR96527.1 MFS transporter [Tetrahymena thermophila SB210]|eukprot:XP_001016772.1 MFS transporter [Tetrahymena thermophila SB210]